jgi:putative spermidine/putrescine transport system ATP-binding protein
MHIEIRGISIRYADRPVLDNVSFAAQAGDIVSIVGPSGVGKTTLLRIIAGLEHPHAGEVLFSGLPAPAQQKKRALWEKEPEHPAIMVFQDYLLFPNLTVHDNVAFGLKARRTPRPERARRVEEMLHFFQLHELAGRYPVQLSAGQKQRVAIARAMVVNPAVLLLDEPFANLDRNLKLSTAEFIRSTQKTFGTTTISVTHDLEEAFAMSDRIGVMLNGRLEQYDTPENLHNAPIAGSVAEFLGPVNVLDAAACLQLGLPHGPAGIRVRPEALLLAPDPAGPGKVLAVRYGGHHVRYTVHAAGTGLTVYAMHDTLKPGDRVRIDMTRALPDPDRTSGQAAPPRTAGGSGATGTAD